MRISDTEVELMKILWERSPLGTPDLVSEGVKRFSWDESTTKTLIARLYKKGAIQRTGEKRCYLYSPAITADSWKKTTLRNFVEKMFSSDPLEMMSFFAKSEKLSSADLKRLEKIISNNTDNKGDEK